MGIRTRAAGADFQPPLDPQLRAYSNHFVRDLPEESLRLAMTPADARRMQEDIARLHWNVDMPVLDTIEELTIDLPGRVLRARKYSSLAAQARGQVCVFFHGGGGVIGSIDTHDGLARRLASVTNLVVISVGYRPGPEHTDAAAVSDAIDSCAWLAAAGSTLDLDTSSLAICGDSFGATLALRAAMADVARIRCLSLLYGMIDTTSHCWSARAFGEGFGLTNRLLHWFDRYRRHEHDDRHDVLGVLSLLAQRDSCPPTQLVVAELDPLRSGNERLSERLVALGALADFSIWPGMPHGFLNLPPSVPMTHAALTRIGAFLGTVGWDGALIDRCNSRNAQL